MVKRAIVFSSLLLFICSFSFSQSSDTPLAAYAWKGSKTKAEPGYVILKSGKKLEGSIALKGSLSNVTEINYEGGGKKISFPPAALQAYGLNRKVSSQATATASSSSGPVSDSPASMYEWKSAGIVMGKEITVSEPRDGYVILNNGTKISGRLKLKKKDGVLSNYEIKNEGKKKLKGEITDVARYGYNVSEESVQQENLAETASKFYRGTVNTGSNNISGDVSQVRVTGKFYSDKILLKSSSGKLTQYTPTDISSFTQTIDGVERKYMAVEGTFVQEEYNGNTFVFYRNPFPTTINQFATSLAKTGMEAGTSAVASAAVKKDAKDNGYETNMDSVIRVSSSEDLIKMRDALVQAGGYSSADELMERSNNESLKTNVNAIEFALAGREAANSPGGVLNKEWVIMNKTTGEKTIIYKGDHKKIVEPLLKGCYDYLSMSKGEQNSYEKWSAKLKMVKLIDGCY